MSDEVQVQILLGVPILNARIAQLVDAYDLIYK